MNIEVTLTPAQHTHLLALIARTRVSDCITDDEAVAIYTLYRQLKEAS